MNKPPLWTVPKGAWKGEPCFILGGGPSLKAIDVNRLRGKGRVIAINAAFLIAPWADVLYIADLGCYRNFKDRAHLFEGEHFVTRSKISDVDPAHNVKRVNKSLKMALSDEAGTVVGQDSGSNSLNLAYLFGASPIYLLGFDMTPGNWHDLHHKPQDVKHFKTYTHYLTRMAPELARRGIEVFNCNPKSALTCFPFADLNEVLA